MKTNSIKLVILILLLTSQSYASHYSECLELRNFKPTLVPSINYSIDPQRPRTHNDIIIDVMNFIKKIVDLKFKMVDYLENNKEIYGEYESLNAQKKEIDSTLNNLKNEKATTISSYDQQIKLISTNLSSRDYRKVYQSLMANRKNDLGIIEDKIVLLEKNKGKVDFDYFKALEKWAPYKEHLERLESLEKSLLDSLQSLAKIESYKIPVIRNVATDISSFSLPTANNPLSSPKRCIDLLRKLEELSRLQY